MPIDAFTADEAREAYEALIKEKDQRIAELEKEIDDLNDKIRYYEDELVWYEVHAKDDQ